MHILVTGSAGQLGCCLAERLAAKKIAHTLVSRSQLDITDSLAVAACVANSNATVVINAAAYTAVDKAEDEPELARLINVTGAQNLAAACAALDIPLLHVSTDYVFDGDASQPYLESDRVGPTGVYGQTKLDGEIAVQQSHAKHVILRTAWVFSEHGGNFVKTMLRLAQTRRELSVVGDQLGCPTYAGHIADALIDIATALDNGSEAYGVFHYCGNSTVSWFDFSQAIFAAALAAGKIAAVPLVTSISTDQYPTPAKRPAFSALDCSKIGREHSIPASDWAAGIESTLAKL